MGELKLLLYFVFIYLFYSSIKAGSGVAVVAVGLLERRVM